MRPPLSYIPLLPATTGVVVGILAAYYGLPAWWIAALLVGGITLLCIRGLRPIGGATAGRGTGNGRHAHAIAAANSGAVAA